jgi:transposase
MARPSKYPAEFRDRAVRMVLESTAEYGSQWAAIMSICKQLGVNHETLRKWVRQAEADSGHQPGITTEQLEANLAGLVATHGDDDDRHACVPKRVGFVPDGALVRLHVVPHPTSQGSGRSRVGASSLTGLSHAGTETAGRIRIQAGRAKAL